MSAAPTANAEPHALYQQFIDISTEIQLAREEIYDACEKPHLLMDDSNPTLQKDNAIASESYQYAKNNFSAPYYKEILRVMGNFQKRVNNARIKIEKLTKLFGSAKGACCETCSRNIQIKQILLQLYFQKDAESVSPMLSQLNLSSTFVSESLTISTSSFSSI